ncbi:hypothetical protein G6O69_37455 [Pseudenhygromyxa sp. WMMC2535]|uniref:hypothetical protein n=1 Tax=Pseudenhygromyxa sp. WMMC2535 TaxID=2712867 RepID=UPI001554801D|nr:hypothetical protein [Pseudenhygromyxa sp. WMMC2535]NVB37196.1 hypothetical protein [Pseudenhygromyxa sp. WMMC2535]NVB43563.1 hypothetical protein [Pseudenhygromyxa sp. WMMC2535]
MGVNHRVLSDLLSSKPAVAKLFDAMREGDLAAEPRTTVDAVAALEGVSRREAVDALRALEGAGVGEFKVGRKGHPSRLEWTVDPEALAEGVEEGDLSELPTLEPAAPAAASAPESKAKAKPKAKAKAKAARSELSLFEEDADADAGSGEDEEPDAVAAAGEASSALEEVAAEGADGGPEAAQAADAAALEPVGEPAKQKRKGRRKRGSQGAPAVATSEAPAPAPAASVGGGIEHVHRLRADFEVRVALPADLSPAEAKVLADWVANLSFER